MCLKVDRECVDFEMVRESVPSRRAGVTERASSVCRQLGLVCLVGRIAGQTQQIVDATLVIDETQQSEKDARRIV